MSTPLQGFMKFVREQGVVGLAVGIVLGTAVKSVVDSLVNNIVNPVIGVLIGSQEALTELSWHINGQNIRYGLFLNSVLQFVIVAAVVYFAVTGLKLDKLDLKKEDAPAKEPAKDKAAEKDDRERKKSAKK